MKKNRQKGFTLIEIIVTLIVVGILASIAGMGIVPATRSYLFSRDASAMAQKAQAAYARMGRTLLNISDINSSNTNATQLEVTIDRQTAASVTETFLFSGNTLSLQTGGSGPFYPLLDNLANTSGFTYLQNDGTNWTTANDEADLSRILVNINMIATGGQTVPFSGSFVPRNIYRPVEISDFTSGGTPMPNVSACFISSAIHIQNKTDSTRFIYLLAAGILIFFLISAFWRKKNENRQN